MSYDTQLDLACDRLRMAVRNEQQVERNAAAWRKLESKLRRTYVGSSGTIHNTQHRR